MSDELNRADLIELLDKLGDASEPDVLITARLIHEKIATADVTWDELLIPDYTDEDTIPDYTDEDTLLESDSSDTDSDSEPLPDQDNSDALTIIEKLLRGNLSDTTRQELIGYKEDINEGDFDTGDLKYLKALSGRLSKD